MEQPSKKQILVVCGPAYGHLMPLLLLSRKLAANRRHTVTFAVSRHKAQQLAKAEFLTVTPDEDVRLLPIDDQSQQDIGHDDLVGAFHDLNHVINPAIEAFTRQIAAHHGDSTIRLASGDTLPRPDVVIFDMFLSDPIMRHRLPGVKYYFFQSSPISLLRWFLLFNADTRVVSPEEHQYFHEFPMQAGQPLAGQMAGAKELFLPIAESLPRVDGIICNSFEAMEREDVELMRKERPDMAKVPVYCLGPFIPEDSSPADSEAEKWLANKDAQSVVYVSFGSIDFMVPKAEQLKEIGKALVQLNKPVLWSLRAGNEAHLPPEISSHPDFLIQPWVPQKRILASPAVAVFLSHSGWNGTLEALSCGVPIVSFPMLADQLLVGTAIEEKGVGVRLRGTGYKPQRRIPADEIARVLREVGEFESKGVGKFHQKARAVSEQIKKAMEEDGTSSMQLADFMRSFGK